jgi:hypothetical protein
MATLLARARQLLDSVTDLTSISDHPRMVAHRTLCSEKAKALAAAEADITRYAADIQRIAGLLREARVSAALGEGSAHDEATLRAEQAAVEAQYVGAQEQRATLHAVLQRLSDREVAIVGELTAELSADIQRRDADMVPVLMALADALIDLNRRRLNLHRMGVDAKLLPVIPELSPAGAIARWREAAQDAGFEPVRK